MKLHMISLGCVRNLVDSEVMSGCLEKDGWTVTDDPAEADVIVINTCGFITSAIDESIDTILEMAAYKKEGRCRKLIVAGCLPERFREDLARELSEVDVFLGAGAYDKICDAASLNREPPFQECLFPSPESNPLHKCDTPRKPDSPFMRYLKVAEGCNRRCTYCIIPTLRGNQRSRSADDIVAEAKRLIKEGAREIILVAQETTDYGSDLTPARDISDVAARIADISNEVWVRILYGHPESVSDRLLETVASRDNICSYFDIPIQHASDPILKKMGRHYKKADLIALFRKIRRTVPDAVIRTTVITGFPGETEEHFKELLDFAEEIKFDHLGVFVYSDGDDLPSHRLPDHVPEEIADRRFDALMACQAQVSFENNRKHLGRKYSVLIEKIPEEGLAEGRTPFQAPEVDGITYVDGDNLKEGDVVEVTITDTFDYDLIGE